MKAPPFPFRLRIFLGATLPVAVLVQAAGPDAVSFSRDIRPILSNHCYPCHGPDEDRREAGLRLDLREEALSKRTTHPVALVPGDAGKSELFRRVTATDPEEVMPPPEFKKPLQPGQIEQLRQWIEAGAPYEPHWSWVPPTRLPPPLPGKNLVDEWILPSLKERGLEPNPMAPAETLVRRLYLDLIGLPPPPETVEAFEADPSGEAYARLVDTLLEQPQFGEKWARGWLDLARYADSNGFQRDGFRDIWGYRDYVIRAFNEDKPYDQFVIEQLAGDLLPDASPEQKIATGFNRCTPINLEAGTNPEADRVNQVLDRVNTMGTVFLGLTLTCAQCHHHKYDPISQTEYYQLFAYFNNTPLESRYRNNDKASLDFIDGPALAMGGQDQEVQKKAVLQQQYNRLLGNCAEEEMTPQQKKELAALKKKLEAIPVHTSLVMQEMAAPRRTHRLDRGQWDKPMEEVKPGVPSSLPPLPPNAPPNRLGLARWIASPDNPLTARVAVNRLWAELFGEGLVRTPEDFGLQGEAPTHPELLDALAIELMEHNGSIKHVLRTLVLSQTYRQDSRSTPEARGDDPDNHWLGRGPRFRLPAETIRDQALALAGVLSPKMYGPPVYPPQPNGVWRVTGKVDNKYYTSKGEDAYRRGIYTIWRRSAHYPSFANFDAPDRGACVVSRRRTNTPQQALTLMNDPVYVGLAMELAKRMLRETADTPAPEPRIDWAFRLVLSRQPTPEEMRTLLEVVQESVNRYAGESGGSLPPGASSTEEAVWFTIATILLNLDETITKS